MKAKFGAIVTEGRGKLSGHVFTNGRSGQVMKTKTSPLLRNTNKQMANRGLLSSLSSSWNSLDSSERNAWNDEVKNYESTDSFGNSRYKSGFALYMQVNLNLVATGRSMITFPLPKNLIVYNTSVRIETDISAGQIRIMDLSPIYDGVRIIVYGTSVVNDGVTNPFKFQKKLGWIQIDGTSMVINSLYSAVFGSIPVSGNYSIGFSFVSTAGTASPIYFGKVTFVP